jgi:two-component system chemotaxis response regulator CheB
MIASAIVVVGVSAAGLTPLRAITESLPRHCKATLFVVIHAGNIPSLLPEILSWRGRWPVEVGRSALIEPGRIYVAPPDKHMLVSANRIRVNDGPLVHQTRPAIDPLFASAADAFGKRVVGVVLSGSVGDGAAGLAAIKSNGGLALVQEAGKGLSGQPRVSTAADIPAGLPIDAIARRVAEFCTAARM